MKRSRVVFRGLFLRGQCLGGNPLDRVQAGNPDLVDGVVPDGLHIEDADGLAVGRAETQEPTEMPVDRDPAGCVMVVGAEVVRLQSIAVDCRRLPSIAVEGHDGIRFPAS